LDDRARSIFVRRIAREGDPDRGLAALFAPLPARESLLALTAFNVELTRIAEQVKEPAVGEIRLQWWREALNGAGKGERTGNPVADTISEVLCAYPALRTNLDRLIDARRFDIVTKIMPNRPALDAYLDSTAGAMFEAAAALLGAKADEVDRAARAGGLAYGLTGLMRALPFNASRGRVNLPADDLRRHGTSPEQLLAGETSEGLGAILAELRGEARGKLAEALVAIRNADAGVRAAFLPLALVGPYLGALSRVSRDPLHEVADINPLYRLWRLTVWRGR
jgi:phytoene synthase